MWNDNRDELIRRSCCSLLLSYTRLEAIQLSPASLLCVMLLMIPLMIDLTT